MQYNIYGEFSSCIIEPFAPTATCPPNYSPAVNDTNKCCKNNLANYSTQYFTQSKTCQHCLLSQNLINEKCNPDNITSYTYFPPVLTSITGSTAASQAVQVTDATTYIKTSSEAGSHSPVTDTVDAPSVKKNNNGKCPNTSDHNHDGKCYKVNECPQGYKYNQNKQCISCPHGSFNNNTNVCDFNGCPNNETFNSVNKKCYYNKNCPSGTTYWDYKCYNTLCNGSDIQQSTIANDGIKNHTCYSQNCPNGVYDNKKCYSTLCAPNTELKDRKCYSKDCPTGSKYKDTKCYSTTCPNGVFNDKLFMCELCATTDYYDNVNNRCIRCPPGMIKDPNNVKKCIFSDTTIQKNSTVGSDATIYNAINKA